MHKAAVKLDSGKQLVLLGVTERNLERIQYESDPLVADLGEIDIPEAIFILYRKDDEQSQANVQAFVDQRKHGPQAMICAIGSDVEELDKLRKASRVELTPGETMPSIEKAIIYYARTDAELESAWAACIGEHTQVRDLREHGRESDPRT